MKIHFHEGDLPGGVDFGKSVAIDTETLGLNPLRDALCLAQLSGGDGHFHVVRFDRKSYKAPNLVGLLEDPDVGKIFHYARFYVAVFQRYLNVSTSPIWCTKIASKLIRTYTDRHGLKYLLLEYVGVDVSKAQQTSDWGQATLTEAQKDYAASDVLYLHKLKDALEAILIREGRMELLRELGTVVWLDGDVRELHARASRMRNRPMLEGRSPAEIDELHRSRVPYYRRAHITIDTTGLGADQVVARVLSALRDAHAVRA